MTANLTEMQDKVVISPPPPPPPHIPRVDKGAFKMRLKVIVVIPYFCGLLSSGTMTNIPSSHLGRAVQTNFLEVNKNLVESDFAIRRVST